VFNSLEEVKQLLEDANCRVDQADLIRQGADRDMLQATQSVQRLNAENERLRQEANQLMENNSQLMRCISPIVQAMTEPGDTSFLQSLTQLPARFPNYVRGLIREVLVRVIASVLVTRPNYDILTHSNGAF